MDLELFFETIEAVHGDKALRGIPAEFVLPSVEQAISKVARADNPGNLTYNLIHKCYLDLDQEENSQDDLQIPDTLISTRRESMRAIMRWILPCIRPANGKNLYHAFIIVSDPGQGKSYFAQILTECIKSAINSEKNISVELVDTRSVDAGESQSNTLRDLREDAIAIIDGPFPQDSLIAKSKRNYVIFIDRDKLSQTVTMFSGITTYTFDLEKMDAGHITECLDAEYSIADKAHITNIVQKYLSGGATPKLIIDSIKLAAASEAMNKNPGNKLNINENLLEYVIQKAGVNISFQVDIHHVRESLNNEIFGQARAVNSVIDGIALSRFGLRKKNRPIYVGLFVGPTGTGKTQLAKALSEALYPGVGMVRINMNQMISDHMSSMLTGAAPGYVGYGKDTPFIAQLKANSRRVILFDEVEKAAKGVLDNLLNMLDEGNFTTARGEELDLTSAIIILSSNALADQFHKQTVGFSQTGGDKAINDGNIAQRLIEAKAFSPEFVNRMDDVVVFSELSDKEVDLIARKGIEKIIREFSYRNITVKADIEALIKDIKKRANKMLGGRDVMRLVDRVGKNLAHKVLENPNVSEIEATV